MNRPGAERSPELSVIIPLYQAGTTVERTLASVLEGEPTAVEVIVVDDGSIDDGPRRVEAIARADTRIRLISQPNRGPSAARNAGILEHARGKWIRFLDADDWAMPESCARLIACAVRRGTDAACGANELFDEHGEPLGRTSPAATGADGAIGFADLLESNRCGLGTIVIKAEALRGVRFDPSMRHCEDWDFLLHLASEGARIAVCAGEPVAGYRVCAAGLSKDFRAMFAGGRAALRRAHELSRKRAPAAADVINLKELASTRRLAFEWAAMCALSDRPHALRQAEEILALYTGPSALIAPREAAASAFWAAILSLGIAPERHTSSDSAWLTRTAAWWDLCTRRGWLPVDETPSAWEQLAGLIAPPLEVAAECVHRAVAATGGMAGGLVVFGAGANGRLVAKAAAKAGVQVEFRDDRIDAGRLDQADLPAGSRCQRFAAPLPARWGIVVSALDDAELVRRIGAQTPVRWARVRQELAARALAAIHGATAGSPGPPMAAAANGR